MERPPDPRMRTFLGFTASTEPGVGVYCRWACSRSFIVNLRASIKWQVTSHNTACMIL